MTDQCRRGCTASRKCGIHDGFTFPYPPDLKKRLDTCLAFGNTAIVEILPSGNAVKKSPHPQECSSEKARQVRQLMREVRVYSQLPPHNRLLKMIDYSDDVFDAYIIFEHMKHGSLEAYLDSNAIITYAQRLKWSIQAAEGITFLHQFGIIHGDIKPQNMLLDDKLCLRIIDFSGSSVDGLPPLGLESTRYFLPRSMESAMPCTITTDLFALGSSLYHIMRGSPPYANIDDEEVQQLYQQQSFPDLVDVPI